MSMYAINESALNESAINDSAIDESGVERVTSNPAAGPPRPYLRLVPPIPTSGRSSRAVFRRRRLAALVMAVALVLAAKAAVGGPQAGIEKSPAESSAPASVSAGDAGGSYVVKQGDTLWGIARQLQSGGDVRPLVDRLAARRGGAPLRVGEHITLP